MSPYDWSYMQKQKKQTLTQRVKKIEKDIRQMSVVLDSHGTDLYHIRNSDPEPYTAMRSTGKKKESIIIECQWCGASHSEDKPFRHYDGCHKDIKPQEDVKEKIDGIMFDHRMNCYGTTHLKLTDEGLKEMKEHDSYYVDRILAIVKGE